MLLVFISFISGVLTVLAPCVLPIIPVILGNTVSTENKRRDKVIIFSLAASVFFFTLLLKATTLLIDIDPGFWNYLSGIIITVFGFITLFPEGWELITNKLGISTRTAALLNDSTKSKGIAGDILIGASLGPVFSSCSPTYSLIIATILPVSLIQGTVYLVSYVAGLALVLLLISRGGQRFTSRLKWALNPHGIFKKILGGLLIITGVVIITGLDKKFQIYLLDNNFFDVTKLEQKILDFSETTTLETEAPVLTGDNNSQPPILNVKNPIVAPELEGISQWINTEPLKLSSLRGKVVVVDFWTYSCINCVRTLPYLKLWHEKYADKGLVILGVHSPEFSFEKKYENVKKFVDENELKYPIGLDNDFMTWRAYNNRYWPAKYFIDKKGNIRHFHFGEGAYKESEEVIKYLLSEYSESLELDEATQEVSEEKTYVSNAQTPETYLGYKRFDKFLNKSSASNDTTFKYVPFDEIPEHYWTLDGNWEITEESIISRSDNSRLLLNFSAKDVYLVMGPEQESKISTVYVKLNGSGNGLRNGDEITLDGHRLYNLVSLSSFSKNQILEITVPSGTVLNAFTFGSL